MADDPQSLSVEARLPHAAVTDADSPSAASPPSASDPPPRGTQRPPVTSYRPPMAAGTVIAWLTGLVALMLASALLRYDAPGTVRLPWIGTALPESCGAKRNFGLDCPGCGLTRSFILSADGRWAEAFQMHPAGTFAFAFLALLIPLRLWQGYRIRIGKPPRSTIVTEMIVLASLLGLSVVWWLANSGLPLLQGLI